MIEDVSWLGHAAFRITADIVVYVDPWKIQDEIQADIILITHPHHDHCSPEDIQKIIKDNTVIVTVEEAAAKLPMFANKIKIVRPGDKLELQGTLISVIPAYNKNKEYHPKSNKWVGYVIEILGERLYFAGDTDYISEMGHLNDISIAFLPVGGIYTMGPEEAVKAALEIHPKYVVPMHYGDIVGQAQNAEDFKSILEREDPTIEVVIKEEEL